LVGQSEPFLSREQQDQLADWWLVHKRGAKLPTWDLVVAALDKSGRPGLVLIEAKAHASELSEAGKQWPQRKSPEEQKRSNGNHERIGRAISEATISLQHIDPDIRLSRDKSYQLSNRIAFAWKLASMGIPVALIYLGFIGDAAISCAEDCFHEAAQWRKAFLGHAAEHFPARLYDREINSGAASFWFLFRELPVLRQSPPIEHRRVLESGVL
jgi:hypothetical protein